MKFGWVMVFFWCICFAVGISTKVYPAELPVWQGFYVDGQFGDAVGEHTLSYNLNKPDFHVEIYSIPQAGSVQAIGLGYRHTILKSRLYWGLQAMGYFGTLSGTEEWSLLQGHVGTEVSFSAQTVYTTSVELGYAFAPRWYGYIQGGIAGAQVSLSGEGKFFNLHVADSANGWALGTYVALGVKYDLGNNWDIGAAYQEFQFAGSQDVVLWGRNFGSLDATEDIEQIVVTISYRF